MKNKENINKVYNLLTSLMEVKTKYVEILTKEGELVCKSKITVEDDELVKITDTLFDGGYVIKKINKEEFENFKGVETLRFNF